MKKFPIKYLEENLVFGQKAGDVNGSLTIIPVSVRIKRPQSSAGFHRCFPDVG